MSEEAQISPEAPQTDPSADAPPPQTDFVAVAGKYYRNTRYILVAALFIYGIYSIRDGFYNWPHLNQNARDKGYDKMPYSNMDILFNQFFGVVLPPGAILLLAWSVRISRGQIRLTGDTLEIPGHPPMPLSAIESVDKQKWERKGIAFVTYQLDDGTSGKFKLDDFVYQREPVDQIFQRIEHSLTLPKPAKAPKPAPAPAQAKTPAVVPVTAIPRPRVATPPPPPRPRIGGR
jgi:hypothetical protein